MNNTVHLPHARWINLKQHFRSTLTVAHSSLHWHSHTPINGGAAAKPHWEQLRVQCLARGHFKHTDSWDLKCQTFNHHLATRYPPLSRSCTTGQCLALAALPWKHRDINPTQLDLTLATLEGWSGKPVAHPTVLSLLPFWFLLFLRKKYLLWVQLWDILQTA